MIPRVSYDDLYPRAEGGDEPTPGVFKGAGRWPEVGGPCWVCRRDTRWVSLAFEAPVCSAVCDEIGWERYWSTGGSALQEYAPGHATGSVPGSRDASGKRHGR